MLVGQAHSVWQAGGSAANSGVQFTEIGSGGLFTADDVRRHAKAPATSRCCLSGHYVGANRKHAQPSRWHCLGSGRS